ncbi:MAG: hypothetical protein LQ338_007378 [Usnochroma carphineum]|nr:MAG: hypothetical protein LQ338_007378 [Usnochroma carphineum]
MDSALHQLAGSQRSYPGDSAKTGDGGNEVVKRLQLAAQRAKPSIRRAWNDPVHPTPAINLTSSSIDLAVIPTVSSENLVSGNRTNADPAESPTRMKSSILITEQPNSAYVVIPELSAGNACTQIARYTSLTFSFGPGELSTIQGPENVTKAFDFGDVPCPPPGEVPDATQTYVPVVAPFSQLYDLNPAFTGCTVVQDRKVGLAAARQAAGKPNLILRAHPLPKAKGSTLAQWGSDSLLRGPLELLLPQQVLPRAAHRVPKVPLETGSASLRKLTKRKEVLLVG